MLMTPTQFIYRVVRRTANWNEIPEFTLASWQMYHKTGLVIIQAGKIVEYVKKGLFHGAKHKIEPEELDLKLTSLGGKAISLVIPGAPLQEGEKPEIGAWDLEKGPNKLLLLNLALGLVGESAEFFALVFGPLILGRGKLDREKLVLEAGDLLWYVGLFFYLFGSDFTEAFEAVDKKLAARYLNPDGSISFSSANSKDRGEPLFEEEV